VRSQGGQAASQCKSLRCFACPVNAMCNAFFRLRLTLAQVLKVVRFRLGCSALPSIAQQCQGVCCAQRGCSCYTPGALGAKYLSSFKCPLF